MGRVVRPGVDQDAAPQGGGQQQERSGRPPRRSADHGQAAQRGDDDGGGPEDDVGHAHLQPAEVAEERPGQARHHGPEEVPESVRLILHEPVRDADGLHRAQHQQVAQPPPAADRERHPAGDEHPHRAAGTRPGGEQVGGHHHGHRERRHDLGEQPHPDHHAEPCRGPQPQVAGQHPGAQVGDHRPAERDQRVVGHAAHDVPHLRHEQREGRRHQRGGARPGQAPYRRGGQQRHGDQEGDVEQAQHQELDVPARLGGTRGVQHAGRHRVVQGRVLRHLVDRLRVEPPRVGTRRDRVRQGVRTGDGGALAVRRRRHGDERGQVLPVEVPAGHVGLERRLVARLVHRGAHEGLAGSRPAAAVREAQHAVHVLWLVGRPERRGQDRPEHTDRRHESRDQGEGSAVRRLSGIVAHTHRIGANQRRGRRGGAEPHPRSDVSSVGASVFSSWPEPAVGPRYRTRRQLLRYPQRLPRPGQPVRPPQGVPGRPAPARRQPPRRRRCDAG